MPASIADLMQALEESEATLLTRTSADTAEGPSPTTVSALTVDRAALQCIYFTNLSPAVAPRALCPAYQHLLSSPPLSVLMAEDMLDEGDTRPSSSLWLLSLVSHTAELVRTVSVLFRQFNEQFAAAAARHRAEVVALQARQEQQLAALLDVDADLGVNMIVNSSVTEHLVRQHQQEVEALLAAGAAAARTLERELQRDFYVVLHTSAPDAMAALGPSPQRRSLAGTGRGRTGGSMCVAPNGSGVSSTLSRVDSVLQYRAEVNVSRYAARYTAPAGTGAAPVEIPVPVRTLVLASTRPGTDGARSSPSSPTRSAGRPTQGAAAAREIVVDLSPFSALQDCLLSCCSPSASPLVALAAEEHLKRLAHAKVSMLFIIGPTRAAEALLYSADTPELLLAGHSACGGGGDRFIPLTGLPAVQVLFTTRLWGANTVLLWDPTSVRAGDASVAEEAPPRQADIVSSVVRLALAWGVDMFSIALLPSAVGGLPSRPAEPLSPQHTPSPTRGRMSGSGGRSGGGGRGNGGDNDGSLTGGPSRRASVSLRSLDDTTAVSLHLLSDVCAALRDVAAASAQRRPPPLWTVQDEELRSRHYLAESAAPTFPRAVGVGHASTRRSSTRRDSAGMTMAVLPASAPAPVLFNTPMAVRLFLPMRGVDFLAPSPTEGGGESSAMRVATSASVSPSPSPPRGSLAGVPVVPDTGEDSDELGSSFVSAPRGWTPRPSVDGPRLAPQLSLEQALEAAFGTAATVY